MKKTWFALIITMLLRGAELPGRYFRLLDAGAAKVAADLDANPGANLKTIEARSGWRHFPYAILAQLPQFAPPAKKVSEF